MAAKRRSAAISRTYRLATSTDELFAIYPARTFLLRLSRSAGGGPALTAVELAIGILTVRVPIPTTCGRAGLSSASQYGIYVRLLLAVVVVVMLVVAGGCRIRSTSSTATSWRRRVVLGFCVRLRLHFDSRAFAAKVSDTRFCRALPLTNADGR